MLDAEADFISRIGAAKRKVDLRLESLLPSSEHQMSKLTDAARYSLLGPGKKFRPIITVATTMALGGDENRAIDPACAIEMIHTASLIIDDLPSMDDAKMRRGQPANHIRYGEDIATLAAIAILSQSFGVVARTPSLSSETRMKITNVLSTTVGLEGLASGQALDLEVDAAGNNMAHLETMQEQKTGSLFVAATEIGALVAEAGDEKVHLVREFGRRLGLAFQILDDLLDVKSDIIQTGKDVQQDVDKATFPSLLGLEDAEKRAVHEVESAMAAVSSLEGSTRTFAQMAHMMLASHMEKIPQQENLGELNRQLADYQ